MSILIWDEAFVDADGVLKWCSRPKVAVPVPLVSDGVDVTRQPFILASSPSKQPQEPYLKAESLQCWSKEALCQIPDLLFEQKNC